MAVLVIIRASLPTLKMLKENPTVMSKSVPALADNSEEGRIGGDSAEPIPTHNSFHFLVEDDSHEMAETEGIPLASKQKATLEASMMVSEPKKQITPIPIVPENKKVQAKEKGKKGSNYMGDTAVGRKKGSSLRIFY